MGWFIIIYEADLSDIRQCGKHAKAHQIYEWALFGFVLVTMFICQCWSTSLSAIFGVK